MLTQCNHEENISLWNYTHSSHNDGLATGSHHAEKGEAGLFLTRDQGILCQGPTPSAERSRRAILTKEQAIEVYQLKLANEVSIAAYGSIVVKAAAVARRLSHVHPITFMPLSFLVGITDWGIAATA